MSAAREATRIDNESDLGIIGRRRVRDIWRQRDLGVRDERFEAAVSPPGVVLVSIASSP
jgi:alpha-galactosidase